MHDNGLEATISLELFLDRNRVNLSHLNSAFRWIVDVRIYHEVPSGKKVELVIAVWKNLFNPGVWEIVENLLNGGPPGTREM